MPARGSLRQTHLVNPQISAGFPVATSRQHVYKNTAGRRSDSNRNAEFDDRIRRFASMAVPRHPDWSRNARTLAAQSGAARDRGRSKEPMIFFATSHAARVRALSPNPLIAALLSGASPTSNPLEPGVRGRQTVLTQQAKPQRAGSGDLLDVQENAGGREPPGRNTRRHT